MPNLRTDKGSNVIQKSVSFDLRIMQQAHQCYYNSYVDLVWSYDYSKYSETNVYMKERMNCSQEMLYQKVAIGDSCICFY